MTGILYKAYLSYSHSDQVWADWLHGSLERYRVPGHLLNNARGGVKAPLSPVFKDREDLSSASSLSESLQSALEQSESLVVVCSPSAAASRWVNEEIRSFRALHGSDRIFCVIVDGDPQAAQGQGGCFPPALFEGVADDAREPLAADARKYADGKRQALLKIAAALLGVRLDELRRRDLIRRRRQQAVMAIGVVAALTLGGLTISAKLAERQERDQAEQMAAFIVDLGEDLKGDIDLESLARISSTAMSYLEQLDPDRLTIESQIKVGKALRQVGDVNWLQGKSEEALEAFERSRGIYVTLNQEEPENDEVLFQLAQAEFYSGYVFADFGDYKKLREYWNRYLDIARERHESRPDDPRWLLELSYATSNLINIGVQLREPVNRAVLDAIDNNIQLAGRALNAFEGNPEVMQHYGNELAFAADAQSSVCELSAALNSRIASLSIAEQLAALPGAGFGTDLDVALRNSGLANVHQNLGELDAAFLHFERALTDLERFTGRDPSNKQLALHQVSIRLRYAVVLAYQGGLARAREQLKDARAMLEPLVSDSQTNPQYMDHYRNLVLDEVLLARMGDETQRALAWLDQHQPLLLARDGMAGDALNIAIARARYRYERYLLTGIDPATTNQFLLAGLPEDTDQYRRCSDAERLARHGVMVGDAQLVERQVSYLSAAGYRDPYYLEFCANAGTCKP